MQTFLPYESFTKSAECLDRQRLGKQRVEVYQILRTLAGETKGWKNHPAVKQWEGHTNLLVEYGIAICEEWIKRGYRDTTREKIVLFRGGKDEARPWWLGDERLHSSHRANLIRKDAEWYGAFDWNEDPTMPYWWPVK